MSGKRRGREHDGECSARRIRCRCRGCAVMTSLPAQLAAVVPPLHFTTRDTGGTGSSMHCDVVGNSDMCGVLCVCMHFTLALSADVCEEDKDVKGGGAEGRDSVNRGQQQEGEGSVRSVWFGMIELP